MEDRNMRFKKPCLFVSNQRGFTLIELLLVIAILGVLASIAIRTVQTEKAKANDTQALGLAKTLLTAVETEIHEKTPVNSLGFTVGGQFVQDYPEIILSDGMSLFVLHDAANDRYEFYIGHTGGALGFYFWVPGPGCPVEVDGTAPAVGGPVPSDKIVPAFDTRGVYDIATYRLNAGV
jgi:prepilin-type N-terminal cleavage/methylation domain-containing protein